MSLRPNRRRPTLSGCHSGLQALHLEDSTTEDTLLLGSVSKGDCPPAGDPYFRGIGLFAPGTVPF